MAIAYTLPSILDFKSKQNPISVERSLTQIKILLEDYINTLNSDDLAYHSVETSLDDIDLMIKSIDRG